MAGESFSRFCPIRFSIFNASMVFKVTKPSSPQKKMHGQRRSPLHKLQQDAYCVKFGRPVHRGQTSNHKQMNAQ